jgi:hypothetical protein
MPNPSFKRRRQMSVSSSIGAALAWPFLLPGHVVCDALGLRKVDDLIPMLINSLVWTVVGICVVAIVV